jgi:hypothetical protein
MATAATTIYHEMVVSGTGGGMSMGAKRGVPLLGIDGLDPALVGFLRSDYGITTLEELVEAASPELEREAVDRLGNAETFQAAVAVAFETLGPDAVRQLRTPARMYATGAVRPPKR